MLAALGFIVGEQLEDFPAFVNFDGHITGTPILFMLCCAGCHLPSCSPGIPPPLHPV